MTISTISVFGYIVAPKSDVIDSCLPIGYGFIV